ncbi:hypothetical protein [Pseudomonas aeruginosa]|uniref:hypothetical protein n=1 Tax=Pseudomonas aeruginosa TaxID=287 RepID=UPI000FD399D9|nr:hypothetical protein [Pseudomonas aeruginosa]RUJ65334.1 hypothetical protein IPC252_07185 [Pseudomonas aeruginosa]
MTDHSELRRLAEEVIRIERNEDEPISAAWELFDSAANPNTILGLIADLEEARNGMEYQPIMRLKNEIDGLKAENEVLRGALKQFAEMMKSINVPIDLDEILKGTKS